MPKKPKEKRNEAKKQAKDHHDQAVAEGKVKKTALERRAEYLANP